VPWTVADLCACLGILLLAAHQSHGYGYCRKALPGRFVCRRGVKRGTGECFGEAGRAVQRTPRSISAKWASAVFEANVNVPDSIVPSAREKTLYFLRENSALYQLGDVTRSLGYEETRTDKQGNSFVRYYQQYQGVPVFGSIVIVGVNPSGEIFSTNLNYVPNLDIDVHPETRSIAAEKEVFVQFSDSEYSLIFPTSLFIYAPQIWSTSNANPPLLVWVVGIMGKTRPPTIFIVNAKTSSIVDQIDLSADFEIWDANNLQLVDIKPWWPKIPFKAEKVIDNNGKILTDDLDPDASFVLKNLTTVEEYFESILNADKSVMLDNKIKVFTDVKRGEDPKKCSPAWVLTTAPIAKVTYSEIGFIIFCDGWGDPLDVGAHEYTHGILAKTGFLGAGEQAKALNEAYADFFAVAVKNFENPFGTLNDPEKVWKILGPDQFFPGGVIRDLSNPDNSHISTKPEACKRYADHINEYSDACFEHEMSTIMSHAAYFMAVGGNKNGAEVVGITINKLQHIFYDSITHDTSPVSSFTQAARSLESACARLVGEHNIDSSDCEQIKQSFVIVGLREPDYIPPEILNMFQSLLNAIREQARQLIDSLIGNIRQQIEDYLRQLLEQLIQALEEGIDNLIQMLWQEFLRWLENTIQSCCLGITFPMLTPFAIQLWRRKRASSR
jgi:Zn-dependent metalloprotease